MVHLSHLKGDRETGFRFVHERRRKTLLPRPTESPVTDGEDVLLVVHRQLNVSGEVYGWERADRWRSLKVEKEVDHVG